MRCVQPSKQGQPVSCQPALTPRWHSRLCPSSSAGDLFFPRPLCIGKCHRSRRKLPSTGRIGFDIQSLRPPSRPRLSAKQEQVLKLLRQGQSNKVIASQLGLSEATVKVHLGCIMRKLGVANRTQVAIASIELNSFVS